MRINTQQIHNNLNNTMQTAKSRLMRSQLQLTTGKRILKPSDDPIASVQIEGAKITLSKIDQYDKNIYTLKSSLTETETLLHTSQDSLLRIKNLTIQANSSKNTRADLKGIAIEIDKVITHLVDIANTVSASGEYLLAGSRSDTKPIVKNEDGEWVFAGGEINRHVPIADGANIQQGNTAKDIFFNGDQNIFQQLEALSTALKTLEEPELQTAINESIEHISTAMDSVSSTRTSVGARLNTLDRTQSAHSDTKTMTEGLKSSLEDLDYLEATTQFEKERYALKASHLSFSQLAKLALFDYV